MKISKKLIAGFMVMALLVGLVGAFGVITHDNVKKHNEIITKVFELGILLDESLVELLAMTQTADNAAFIAKKSDYEQTRADFDALFKKIKEENTGELKDIGFDIAKFKNDADDVAVISNRLISLHKQRLSKNQEYNEKESQERDIRHKIAASELVSRHPEFSRDFALMQYFSKEALFQYRDQEHIDKWLKQAEKIRNSRILAARPVILNDMDIYVRLSHDLGLIIIEQNNFKDREDIVFAELNILIDLLGEHEATIINMIKEESEDLSLRSRLIQMIVTMLSLIVSIILGLTISRSIAGPISRLKEAAKEVGRGNLKSDVHISSNDEIGELAASFNEMAEDLLETTVSRDELAKEVSVRKEAENKIRTQSEFLKNILESLAHPFYVIDIKDHTLKMVNSSAQKGEMKEGDKCYRATHGLDRPCGGKDHECPIEKIIKTKAPVTVEHLHHSPDGGAMFVEVHAHPIFDKEGNVEQIIEYTLDISGRKKAEEDVQRHIGRINALHSIDKAIMSSFDIGVTVDVLLTQVIAQMKVDAATILRMNTHSALLEYVGGKGFRTDALKYTRLKLGECNSGKAAIERKIVTINDLTKDIDCFGRSDTFPDEGFVSYIGVPLIAKGQVKGVLELFHRSVLNLDDEWMDFVMTLAGQAAIILDNATLFEDMQRSSLELLLAYDSTIEGWSSALDLRDRETEGHSQRVTDITVDIARGMGLNDQQLAQIRRGALLHDIGKMGVPDNILLKTEELTEEEREIMERHPQLAYDMLKNIEYLRPALDIPYCHHEKWDGTGYPRGLKGKDIPLSARIFAIVDVWDALRSDRPYRAAWPKEKVIEHIRSLSGTHFDPEITELFLKMDL